MGSSKLLAAVLLPVALMAPHAPMTTAANSNLFREYIGANFKDVRFSDFPINPNVQFDFILAFAIDYTTTTNPPSPRKGEFSVGITPYSIANHKHSELLHLLAEDSVLTPSAVAEIKQSNPNVRVAVSLGGASLSGTQVFFSITSVDSWVEKAASSLTSIIQQYNLDGIDIDYEQFQVDPATFSECIGRLLTTLKSNGVIQFASIAPFDDPDVQSHYQPLWASNGGLIDYINFHFYGYDKSTTADQYVNHINDQMANYPGGNMLASFIMEPTIDSLPIDTVLSACQTLQSQGTLYGVFIGNISGVYGILVHMVHILNLVLQSQIQRPPQSHSLV
ncbi:Chitinase 2 [Dichanthelium oligosanthes]|uniref:Chitinase 2 n=1 Tax=Dichanthelium oligosanthes TaxID=888268 RepID=A0A1E5VLN2_9POAL|nr:Chitinase 2 [Dichanthelium oligosanthes]